MDGRVVFTRLWRAAKPNTPSPRLYHRESCSRRPVSLARRSGLREFLHPVSWGEALVLGDVLDRRGCVQLAHCTFAAWKPLGAGSLRALLGEIEPDCDLQNQAGRDDDVVNRDEVVHGGGPPDAACWSRRIRQQSKYLISLISAVLAACLMILVKGPGAWRANLKAPR